MARNVVRRPCVRRRFRCDPVHDGGHRGAGWRATGNV